MATEVDRGDLNAARTRRIPWLGLVGVGLAALLLAVAIVQWRQLSMLRQNVRSADDYVVLQVYQAQTEYLRLRETWQSVVGDARPDGVDQLRLRYEIWISRVELLHNPRTRALLSPHPGFDETLRAVDGFVARADQLLGPGVAPPDKGALAALLPALAALDPGLHSMVLDAGHHVIAQMAGRNQTVREHNRIGIGLTLFLSALTLAFAVIAYQQLRRLQQRREELEALAASLRLARQDAEAASNAKSEFLANMSHEIRTPFQGLMGMLSMLRETGLTPRQIDYLRTATESADHLLAILNDILDMSQLESGRMTLAPASVDLRAMLREVEALMRPQALSKGLALHVDADPAVPERVMADPTRVKQVVFNLLSNAIKFSDRGAVVVDLRLHHAADGSPELEFVVSDTGIGMDEATLARVFDRFAQADSSASRRHGGAGLGLEISRNLARLMGGDLTAHSRLGEGSTFTFRLPLLPVLEAPRTEAEPVPQVLAPGQRLRVLVAEDHPVNRQYLAALLESLGHEAHFTTNGEEALRAVAGGGFDVVLMDLHMPVLDGVTATRAIRALPDAKAAALPIVALTADAFAETRERCLVAGMNDFLTKPVSPQELATALRRLFGSAVTAEGGTSALPRGAAAQASRSEPALLDEAAVAAALEAMSRERLAGMIHDFLGQAPQTVQRLRAAIRDAQPLELRVNAHAARGAALNLGLAALASTAQALQEGAAHLPAHEIARLVQRFEELLPATRDAAVAAGFPVPSSTSG